MNGYILCDFCGPGSHVKVNSYYKRTYINNLLAASYIASQYSHTVFVRVMHRWKKIGLLYVTMITSYCVKFQILKIIKLRAYRIKYCSCITKNRSNQGPIANETVPAY